jgi:hypothetical protein
VAGLEVLLAKSSASNTALTSELHELGLEYNKTATLREQAATLREQVAKNI